MSQFLLRSFLVLSTMTAGLAAQARTIAASDVSLPEDATMLVSLRQAKVVDVKVIARCPVGAHCLVPTSTTITLAFTLNGCLDEITPVVLRAEQRDLFTENEVVPGGRVVVEFSGYEVRRKSSLVARCVAPNVKYVSVNVLGDLEGLQFDAEPMIASFAR